LIEAIKSLLNSLLERYSSFLVFVILPLSLGYLVSRAIVNQNYYALLLFTIAIIGFLILKSNILSISIILFLVFAGNWLVSLGYLPAQFNWLVEIIIGLLFIKAISQKIINNQKIKLKYLGIFSLFLSVCLISYLLNNMTLILSFLFLRLLGRYYLLYLAVINLDLDEKSMTTLNKILVFLFIIQVPAAVIKLSVYGQGEQAIGTYGRSGGGLSTVLPLITLCFLIAFYFLYKPSKLYIFLAFCFIAFGIIGGKKAIMIFVPILLIFLGIFMKDRFKLVLRYFLIGGLIIFLTGYFSMKFIRRLNPDRILGGSINLSYLSEYYSRYTTYTSEGKSVGRLATTKNVFKILKDSGFENFVFGFGPGSFIETTFSELRTSLKETEGLPIAYGVTGLSWLAIQVGYFGALVFLFLFYSILKNCINYYKKEKDLYWKSIGFGMVGFSFVMLLISFFYNEIFMDDLVPLIYFMLAAFVETRKSQKASPGKLVD